MRDARTSDGLSDDAEHDAEHGGAAIEKLSSLELLQKDQLLGAVLEPLVVSGGVGHGIFKNESEAEASVREIGLEQGTQNPGTKKDNAEGGDHRVLGVRSVGRLSTSVVMGSAQTELAEDALAGEQLGAQADHEAEHGQTAIPGLGEGDKTEAGGGSSHDCFDLFSKL